MRWLDTTPAGRILNRFTADFNTVDTELATDVAMMLNTSFSVIGICAVAAFVSPSIVILAVFILIWCSRIGTKYLTVARPAKRLESTAKSPVFELYGSALTGMATIRAFGNSPAYIEKMFGVLDWYNVATWHLWLFNRWMGLRMSVLGMIFSSTVAILILASKDMDAALAGFTMSFALDFAAYILWAIRNYADLELGFNAAERVVEYSNLETEELGGEKPRASWPEEGRLEVDELVVGYADDLPAVLKGLTFSVNRNERVGVVGRTGAGKSSLTLALFRFLRARSGSIHIDGQDISKLNLHELRSRLAIIPQVNSDYP
jgi:ABC-type multidrug transport system fused ATPase/permease subunit